MAAVDTRGLDHLVESWDKLVKRFTGEISQSLSTADIMDKLRLFAKWMDLEIL